ncbi:citrate synthase-like protein [Scenedesmus sp. NREL 46B-D3]|nr:citrate synthase-like protein [Scenedesmus sp. NREL 46B-D3]
MGSAIYGQQGELGQLFSKETQAIFFNWKEKPVQRMLDFDFLCGRPTPSVACIVQPGSNGGFQKVFFGDEEIAIPVYGSTTEAAKKHPKADVFVNYASFRSAYESTMEALLTATVRVVAVIAEGVPEKDTKRLIAYARSNNKVIIGPATVGGVQVVGFVSKSGGMSNEMYNVLSRATDGLYEGIAIGGDTFPGSTLSDHCIRYQNIPQIKMIVVLGELGGQDEYSLVSALKEGKVTKPVVAWVSGTCAKLFKSEVQFGHAGARSTGESDSAQAKNAALAAAGAIVPDSFEGLEGAVRATYQKLVEQGVLSPQADIEVPEIPMDLAAAVKLKKVRKPTNVVSTICDDRGEEPTYYGVTMSQLIEEDYGIGDVLALLWFKRKLPKYFTKCIMLCADHGPCVSGAHNSIVTSRAGKDLVSCLVSGLLTIGPRFGGAIDDAARCFKKACEDGLGAAAFVEGLKKQGKRVPGIGHRIKSKDNRDKRVELLSKYARRFFPGHKHLDYAITVEEYTLQKAANLVLNVDGCIGALFLDLLYSSGCFSQKEMDDIISVGYLNGLFVLARSIGLIGHALDQKRLQQPLYRHPWEDVLLWSF